MTPIEKIIVPEVEIEVPEIEKIEVPEVEITIVELDTEEED